MAGVNKSINFFIYCDPSVVFVNLLLFTTKLLFEFIIDFLFFKLRMFLQYLVYIFYREKKNCQRRGQKVEHYFIILSRLCVAGEINLLFLLLTNRKNEK